MAGPSLMVRILGDLQGFAKSVTDTSSAGNKAASSMHQAFSGVLDTLNRTGVLGPFGAALDAVDQGIGQLVEHTHEIAPAMMGVGAALVGVGVGLQALGSKDQAAHQQLQAAVQATGHDYDEYSKQVEEAIKHQEHFGHAANETQDALRILTTATGDPAKALDYLNVATNIAAARHESLSQAATDLSRVYGGNTRLLKLYGIQVTDQEKKSKDYTGAIDELSRKLSGQASAAADTFGGRLSAIKAHMEDSAAAFGEKFGPAITAAGAAMTGLGATIQITSAALTFLRTSQALAGAQSIIMATAMGVLNAVMAVNPIILIVLALAALVGGLILAYQHVTWFRNAINDMGKAVVVAFNAIKTGVMVAINWVIAFLKTNWPLIVGVMLGPIGLILGIFYRFHDQIIGFFKDLLPQIGAALAALPGLLARLFVDAIQGVIFVIALEILGVYKFWTQVVPTIIFTLINLGSALANVFVTAMVALPGVLAKAAVGLWAWFAAMVPLIISYVASLPGRMAAIGIQTMQQLGAGLAFAAGVVWSFAAGIAGRVAGYVAALPGTLYNIGAQALSTMASGMAAAAGAVWNFFTGLPGRIVSELAALPGQMFNLGRDIVLGLINGIGSLAGAVEDKIKSVVTAPINAAKSVLGIHSPSSVFADIGRNTILGYVQGVNDLAGAVSPAVAGAMPTAAAGAPATRGPAVVIQDAHFHDETDIDLFMQRVAWAVQRQAV